MCHELLRLSGGDRRQCAQKLGDERRTLAPLVQRGKPRPPIWVEEVRLLGPVSRAMIIRLRSGDGIEPRRKSARARAAAVELERRSAAELKGDGALLIEQGRPIRAERWLTYVAQSARALVEEDPGRRLIEVSAAGGGGERARRPQRRTRLGEIPRLEVHEGDDSLPEVVAVLDRPHVRDVDVDRDAQPCLAPDGRDTDAGMMESQAPLGASWIDLS